MKNTISIALAGDRGLADVVEGLPELLAGQATADTDYFGEVMVVVEEGGERRARRPSGSVFGLLIGVVVLTWVGVRRRRRRLLPDRG